MPFLLVLESARGAPSLINVLAETVLAPKKKTAGTYFLCQPVCHGYKGTVLERQLNRLASIFCKKYAIHLYACLFTQQQFSTKLQTPVAACRVRIAPSFA